MGPARERHGGRLACARRRRQRRGDPASEPPAALRCVQHAGELIYVPSGWGHAVVNHGDSLALAAEFHDLAQPPAAQLSNAQARPPLRR